MESNYWLTTSSTPIATAGDPPSRADVAIIGAGFTGLSAALALAKKGASVAVLEANTIGWGASSRNGGMVLTGLKLSAETFAKRYGMELTRRMYSTSLESIDVVEQHRPRREHRLQLLALPDIWKLRANRSHFDAYARSD